MSLAVAIPLISGAVGAIGSIAQGQSAAASDRYNASVQQTYAQEQVQQGQEAAAQDARKAALQRGTILANMGASGASGGSGLDVLADTASQGILQEQFDVQSGALENNKYINSATAEQSNANNASSTGVLKAAGDIFGGAGNAFNASQKLTNPAGANNLNSNIGGGLTYNGSSYGP